MHSVSDEDLLCAYEREREREREKEEGAQGGRSERTREAYERVRGIKITGIRVMCVHRGEL
jgi:hypothetical protein